MQQIFLIDKMRAIQLQKGFAYLELYYKPVNIKCIIVF